MHLLRKTAREFAETTMVQFATDLLSDALGLMRVTGNLLLAEVYLPPWAISIPDQKELAAILKADPDAQVVAFHFVHRGCFELRDAHGGGREVHTGELVVCFEGAAHSISQGSYTTPTSLQGLLNGMTNRFRPLEPMQAEGTALVCGAFLLRDTHLNPLFAALPSLLHVRAAGNEKGEMFPLIADILVREVSRQSFGANYAVQRLLELLCLEAIRSHVTTVDETTRSWFRGIRDPLMGEALYLFHRSPGELWSVDRLARTVHLSPSRFAARFAATFGESSMAYVTKWRMNIARHLLNSTDLSVEHIALNVGYQNLPAFSRTFKRFMGASPGAWRTQQQQATVIEAM